MYKNDFKKCFNIDCKRMANFKLYGIKLEFIVIQ